MKSQIALSTEYNWENTLPVVSMPFTGESLLGYLLRLDHINRFTPGTLLKSCIKKNHHIDLKSENILNLAEKHLDIPSLSKLINVPSEKITSMMISEIRKKIYKSDRDTLFNYDKIKVCPECIKEKRIPLVHLLKNTNFCLKHNLLLVSKCRACDQPINIFNSFEPLSCSNHQSGHAIKCGNSDYSEHIYELFIQNAYNSYILDDIPLIKTDKPILEALKQAITLLSTVKKEAIKYIKNYFSKELGRIVENPQDISVFNTSYNLDNIINLLYQFGINPHTFSNITAIKPIYDITFLRLGLVRNEYECINSKDPNIIKEIPSLNLVSSACQYPTIFSFNNCLYCTSTCINGKLNIDIGLFDIKINFTLNFSSKCNFFILHI
ncbi:MAG: TniQ family protein [Deltaproteobacteria bacterium]